MSTKTIDARGRFCPMPIVALGKEAKVASPADELIVLSDDRAFPADVKAWCQKTGNRLLSLQEQDGYFRAVVRKEA